MTNTYWIETYGGKTKGECHDFITERELSPLTSTVWCGKRMDIKTIKKKYHAFTVPVLQGCSLFAVFPAVAYADVKALEHVREVHPLSQRDIDGIPALTAPDGVVWPAKPGLREFMDYVDAEYALAQKVQLNRKAVSKFKAEQAVRFKAGPFEHYQAIFKEMRQGAGDDYAKAVVETEFMGHKTSMAVDLLDLEAAE